MGHRFCAKRKKENEVNLSELQICTIAFNCLLMQTIAVCQYLDLQLKHTITCKNVRVLLCTLIALWFELSATAGNFDMGLKL